MSPKDFKGLNVNQAPSPLKTYILVWGCLMVVIASGLIVYDGVNLYSAGTIYLLSSIVVFSFGYRIAKRYKMVWGGSSVRRSVKVITWSDEIGRYRRLITILAICGIIAAALFAIDMLIVSGLSTSDLMDIRDIFMTREVTVLSQIAAVLGAGGFVSLVSAIICWNYIPTMTRLLWLLSPIALSLFSFLSGGRQTVFQLLLFIYFTLLLRHKIFRTSIAKLIKTTAVFAFIFVLVLTYGMMVSHQRNARQLETNKKEVILTLMQANLYPTIEAIVDDMPDVVRDGATELLVYFTHSLPNFLVFWELDKPGPYWGLWEFPFIARRLNNLGIVLDTDIGRMNYVYDSFAATGRFPQVWQTQIRDMIIDFTSTGAIIGVLLFGYISGRTVKNYELRGGLVFAFLVVGLNLICFYSIMFSAISDTFLFFYFMLSLALLVKSRFLERCDYIVIDKACYIDNGVQ